MSHTLYVLTGAAGAGKTSLAREIASRGTTGLRVVEFDSLGVPTAHEMARDFGSVENWQRATMFQWAKRIKAEMLDETDVLLDAQVRPEHVGDACTDANVDKFAIVLIDCDDESRSSRLHSRGQDALDTDEMRAWAEYLRSACAERNCVTIDTAEMTVAQAADAVEQLIRR